MFDLRRDPLATLCTVWVLLTVALFFLAANGKINAFATYLLALTVIPGLFFRSFRGALRKSPASVWIAASLLLFYLGISSAWSADVVRIDVFRHIGAGALILAFLAGMVVSGQRCNLFPETLLVTIIATATISACFSIYLHVTLPDYQPLPEPRLYGFGRISNPVIAAVSYGMAVYAAVFLLLQSKIWRDRLALGVALLALVIVIVLTGTRVVWLALGVSLGLGVAWQFRSRALLLFGGAVFLTGLGALFALGWEEISRRGLSFRPEIWQEFVTRTLGGHVLMGVGSGTNSDWVTPILTFQHPHSIFVSAFYFGGLMGLLLLLGLIGACVRVIWRAEKSPAQQLALMALSYGLMVGLIDGDNILSKVDHHWWMVWLPVGFCLIAGGKIRLEFGE